MFTSEYVIFSTVKKRFVQTAPPGVGLGRPQLEEGKAQAWQKSETDCSPTTK
jgi:hypothetical protein